jgi:minor extracellular protease Epr
MRRGSSRVALAAGFALASLSCAALAQVGGLPTDKVDKVNDALAKVQQRTDKAQDRVDKAQDRVAKAAEQTARAEQAQERASRAADQAGRIEQAQDRASKAADQTSRVEQVQDRLEKLPEQAARAEKAQERIGRIPDQAVRADKAQDRSAQASGSSERAERASAQSQRSERRGPPEWGQKGGRSEEHSKAPEWSQRGGRSEEHARKPDKGRPDSPGARGKGGERGKAGREEEEKEARRKAQQKRKGSEAANTLAWGPGGAAASALERSIADAHRQRLVDRVLAYPRNLEMTQSGPAVKGHVVAIDPTPAVLAAVKRAGFIILWIERIESLGIRSVTLKTPKGMGVDKALAQLARIAPAGEFTANHLHLQSSSVAAPAGRPSAPLAQGQVTAPALGLIDGGVARHPVLSGAIEQRGFVWGAPAPNAHATAVASLAAGQGRLRGAFPGAPLLVADVYGADPAGGNAVAVAKAIGWMVERRVPVVAITLAGPSNPLVAKAIARASERGLFIVAPVGNGGRAAPPSYPASYPQVVAVTGVDQKNRLLIESGRAFGIDYAAPAAGFAAAGPSGGWLPVRGTSFAVPFVAARMAGAARKGAHPVSTLDREAIDLGPRGPDDLYGRGLVCAKCRPKT